jgi:probable rRNA maturation factor
MPPAVSSVLFRHPSRPSSRRIPRRALQAFLSDLAQNAGHGRPITCLITTDRHLRELNRRFRRQDHPTDVLSFPSSNGGPGELAISLDRAMQQAAEFGHPLDQELRILMLHGVLHLAGMDHETDSGQMARAESRWRKRLGLPPALTERSRA